MLYALHDMQSGLVDDGLRYCRERGCDCDGVGRDFDG